MMNEFPSLETERLIMNRPNEGDTDSLISFLNESAEFSENTLNIPFPYKNSDAEFFLSKIVDEGFADGSNITFAVRLKEDSLFAGVIGLTIFPEHQKAECGYWIAKSFQNKGYVSEALKKIIAFAFEELNLNKIYATYYPHNPASGKVMEKCGMNYEATFEKEIFKKGRFVDLIRFSLLKKEFQNSQEKL